MAEKAVTETRKKMTDLFINTLDTSLIFVEGQVYIDPQRKPMLANQLDELLSMAVRQAIEP